MITERVMELVEDPGQYIDLVPLSKFFPYVEHDRRYEPKFTQDKSNEAIEYFKEEIRDKGIDWVFTIFVSKENLLAQIEEGNHRLRAAFEEGVEQIPLTVTVFKSAPIHGKKIKLSPEFIKSPYVPGRMRPTNLFPFLKGYKPDPYILSELKKWGNYSTDEAEPDYKYNYDNPEQFDIMFNRFNVQLAKILLSKTERETVSVKVSDIPYKGFIRKGTEDKEVDIEVPIIVATLKNGNLIIDGYHRIKYAKENGIERLPAQILTIEETEKIKIF